MDRHIPALFCILFSAFRIALADAVPVRFNADAAAPQTFQAAAYRGETLDIEAQLTLRGAPLAVADGASATTHWQTNGMGAAWWTAPASVTTSGLVRARWTPSMDCGADAYRIFLGVADGGSNLSYRANMLLRMVGSPGETPNALPLPTPFIDFAKVAWTNAPWGGGGGGTLTEETDPVFGEWARTNALPHISTDDVREIVEEGGLVVTGKVTFAGSQYPLDSSFSIYDGYKILLNDTSLDITAKGNSISIKGADLWLDSWLDLYGGYQSLPDYVDEKTAPYATRAWTLSTYGGTNAWMAIDGDLLGIYTCTNAASGTNTLWESSAAMGGQLSDVALRATNNTVRITALEARPDLTSWGDYAPDGTPNPDAEAVLYLNKALTLMGSGFSWATSGAYACLCQSGAVAYHTETNGEVRIGLDVVSNYFGMVQGGSITVGCRTGGIRVEGSGANTVVHLLYAYAGGDFPALWGATTLSGDWTELPAPVWTDYGDGTAEAAVPGSPFHFFKATSSRSMEARFESKAPAAFPGGIYGDFASSPVKYNSVITIQQGGHTYRIPAELVQ